MAGRADLLIFGGAVCTSGSQKNMAIPEKEFRMNILCPTTLENT